MKLIAQLVIITLSVIALSSCSLGDDYSYDGAMPVQSKAYRPPNTNPGYHSNQTPTSGGSPSSQTLPPGNRESNSPTPPPASNKGSSSPTPPSDNNGFSNIQSPHAPTSGYDN